MDGHIDHWVYGTGRKIVMEVKKMALPHERFEHEKKPHEIILERLDKVEEILRRIEEKLE